MSRRNGFDEHGNPLGKAYDLGGVDDERLKGEKILLYVAYNNEPFEWHHAQQAVAERNIQMDIIIGPRNGPCSLDEQTLFKYSQLWYVSHRISTLSTQQVQMIEKFVRQGNGLLIWADNEPYYADANLLAQKLIGTRFSGNKYADQILTLGSRVEPRHFVEHQLTQGVNKLYEGITICTIAPAKDLTILAQSHDGQHCMACFERGEQRIVLDTGFTKLIKGAFHKTAGTARYFRNIAFWLARASRGIEYTLLTPGRNGLATINPNGESERYKYSVSKPTNLTFLLHWEGKATLGMVVQDPQGRIVHDSASDKAPIRVNVAANKTGDWVCWVKGVKVPHAKFPYVLTLAESSTGDSQSSQQRKKRLRAQHPVLQGVGLKAPSERYKKPWGGTHPGCLIILLDQSGSMKDKFGGSQIGAGKRKCDMVATVVNNLLHELVKTNTVGHKIRPRIDLAVLGYEGGSASSAFAGSLANKSFVSLPELMANPIRIETRTRREVDDEGHIVQMPVYFPIWVEPKIGTATPMCAALERAIELAEEWAVNHPKNYPPVVINITDGASTDGDPKPLVEELCQIHTTEGATLLFNCHITNLKAATVEFPSNPSELPHDPEQLAPQLFAFSSEIPQAARDNILNATDQSLPASARGFIFNGDAASVRQMFIFATVGATQGAVDPNR